MAILDRVYRVYGSAYLAIRAAGVADGAYITDGTGLSLLAALILDTYAMDTQRDQILICVRATIPIWNFRAYIDPWATASTAGIAIPLEYE